MAEVRSAVVCCLCGRIRNSEDNPPAYQTERWYLPSHGYCEACCAATLREEEPRPRLLLVSDDVAAQAVWAVRAARTGLAFECVRSLRRAAALLAMVPRPRLLVVGRVPGARELADAAALARVAVVRIGMDQPPHEPRRFAGVCLRAGVYLPGVGVDEETDVRVATVWGLEHCSVCRDVVRIMAERGVLVEELDLQDVISGKNPDEDVMVRAAEQDMRAPVVRADGAFLSWEQIERVLTEPESVVAGMEG